MSKKNHTSPVKITRMKIMKFNRCLIPFLQIAPPHSNLIKMMKNCLTMSHPSVLKGPSIALNNRLSLLSRNSSNSIQMPTKATSQLFWSISTSKKINWILRKNWLKMLTRLRKVVRRPMRANRLTMSSILRSLKSLAGKRKTTNLTATPKIWYSTS